MGNLHAERKVIGVINPADNPYLHIIPDLNRERGEYRYIDSLMGAILQFGRFTYVQRDRIFVPHTRLDVNLLPRLITISPPPYIGKDLVDNAVYENKDRILSQITPAIKIIGVTHGSMWGLYPEEVIAGVLRKEGLSIPDAFPEIGGRKRIKTHAILLGEG